MLGPGETMERETDMVPASTELKDPQKRTTLTNDRNGGDNSFWALKKYMVLGSL